MSDKVNQSASITPPVPGKNTIVRAGTASAERIKLPASWKGWVTIYADGVKVYFAVGGSGVAVDATHTTTLTSEAPSAHGTGECIPVPDGAKESFNLAELQITSPDGRIYLSHRSPAAAGHIRIVHSSGTVPQS